MSALIADPRSSFLVAIAALGVVTMLALVSLLFAVTARRRAKRDFARVLEGLAAVRQALDDQSALIGQLDSRNKAQEIGVGGDRAIDAAVRMARTGASSDQLAASSGLSRQEARLLMRLHGPDRARA